MFIIYNFLLPFFASILLVFLLKKAGERLKVYDMATQDPLKVHKKPISCLGGPAFFLVFLIFNWKVAILGSPVFLVGFADDLWWRDKIKIKPIFKFIFLVLASFLTALFFADSLFLFVLVLVFVFVLINAVNYQDGVDGLAGGEVFISLIGFIALGSLGYLPLAAAILGFLVFNFYPAKIFMGDSGAYFLGFSLAVSAISYSTSLIGAVGSVFILGVPVFDGIFTNIRRLVAGKSIFLGDREHFYDKLIKRGFSVRKTIFVSYALQLISVLVGLCVFHYLGQI